jgi:hypothetical protein
VGIYKGSKISAPVIMASFIVAEKPPNPNKVFKAHKKVAPPSP